MKTILCFVPDQCADFEIILALHMLNGEDGRQIKTVGFSHEPVTAQSGLQYTADFTLEEAIALPEIEVFIMPGGPLREQDIRLTAFLLDLNKRGVLLAAICFAPQYLARSGLLDARRYTTSCSPEHVQKESISDPFPRDTYVEARVITDGNIITAKGYAFIDFTYAIVRYLGLYDKYQDMLDGFYHEMMNS